MSEPNSPYNYNLVLATSNGFEKMVAVAQAEAESKKPT